MPFYSYLADTRQGAAASVFSEKQQNVSREPYYKLNPKLNNSKKLEESSRDRVDDEVALPAHDADHPRHRRDRSETGVRQREAPAALELAA